MILTVISVCAVIPLVVAAVNALSAIRLHKTGNDSSGKKISVLIPARNEERSIARCIQSVLDNAGEAVLEVLVYDDDSEDATASVVQEYSRSDTRVRLLRGGTLPDGWLGKNHSCYELAKTAAGKYFLFIDADVIIRNGAPGAAVDLLEKHHAGLLSVFPVQLIPQGSAWAVTPVMNRILLSSLVLRLVPVVPFVSVAAANGQFMLFSRECYDAVGGHEPVKADSVEDIALARNVKRKGMTLVTATGGSCVYCEMYNDAASAFSGFAKNFYNGTGLPAAVFLMFVLLSSVSFWGPVILTVIDMRFAFVIAVHSVKEILVAYTAGQNVLRSLLWLPVQKLLVPVLAVTSVVRSYRRTLVWKGRTL